MDWMGPAADLTVRSASIKAGTPGSVSGATRLHKTERLAKLVLQPPSRVTSTTLLS